MKKYFAFTMILFAVLSCKKTEYSPEGPTDVRIRNLSDITFYEVIVNTSGGIDTLGDVVPGTVSDYCRFDKAFPKAEISATVNNQKFSTGPVNYTYMQYMGQMRITYEVYISNLTSKELKINNVILEEELIPK